MTTSLSWRASHHWLRGYSDAKAGRDRLIGYPIPLESGSNAEQVNHAAAYHRGYDVGCGKQGEPALDSTGRAQCLA